MGTKIKLKLRALRPSTSTIMPLVFVSNFTLRDERKKKKEKKGKQLSCGNQNQIEIETKSIAAQYLNNNASCYSSRTLHLGMKEKEKKEKKENN